MTLTIVDYLSDTLGERFGGSREEVEAAEFLKEKMEEIGLEVEVQRFNFMGWRLTRGPTLKVLEPEERDLNPGLMFFSANTPSGGITGTLERVGTMYVVEGMFEWPKYAIVGDDGSPLGYVVAFFDGPAISLPNPRILWGRAPHVLVGKDDHDALKRWMDDGKKVVVNFDIAGEFLPDQSSQNVIGTLRGESLPEEEIVVCAHYDSAYGSPGADDNASGVESMLRAAEKLAAKGTKKSVKFLAFGAEEYGLFGSRYYVEDLKERGELGRVKAVINLDMTGAGDTLTLASEPRAFDRMVREAVERSSLAEGLKLEALKLAEDSDHWPFYVNGIPVTFLFFWPYDYYHQPTDTAEKVEEPIVERTAEAVYLLAEMLAYPSS